MTFVSTTSGRRELFPLKRGLANTQSSGVAELDFSGPAGDLAHPRQESPSRSEHSGNVTL